ncbi:hypothetical protein N7G274_006340 [Stereocaulon virgatum]|uniref:Uncharacterized protein n=1 Tax=Stereocaulon virgatum TaxID=373712 RepID=A0ABR4A4P0_9LECA
MPFWSPQPNRALLLLMTPISTSKHPLSTAESMSGPLDALLSPPLPILTHELLFTFIHVSPCPKRSSHAIRMANDWSLLRIIKCLERFKRTEVEGPLALNVLNLRQPEHPLHTYRTACATTFRSITLVDTFGMSSKLGALDIRRRM